jgi:hypothetical protein
MAKPLLPEALWERIEPLLPRPKTRRFRHPGRKPVEDPKALTGTSLSSRRASPGKTSLANWDAARV